MSRRFVSRWLSGFALTALLVVVCGQLLGGSLVRSQPARPVNLTVSAAISLTNALQDVQRLYRQNRSNVTLTYNFGASGALQQQIEQGAPVDIFVSAGSRQMEALRAKDFLLPGTQRNLLSNRVVLVTPKNASGITNFRDLASAGVRRIAIGEPRSVPAGQYAQEVLNSLGIAQQVQPKLVLAQNVRQVLSYVETGNVDAGIVYLTDARQSNRIRIAAFAPANSHSPAVYPVAVIKSSRSPEAARDFVQFLFSPRARTTFERYGFTTAS
ncbi:molybdate ABC transporter substrate-binding protein [Leptolyngbya sp. FACHB-261]|uniref:molybdate ABC transporter substrate-binding protein n=1 Tax=Leptolyngbya sp. FACHB-261 TaxID=2692806 RepID=UPI001682BC88|nr:molybdate ABC transporter substrate-binding protein [Leptolyngbya sp. FACHB-261]MBD2100855.1 molybdate ABC transporter substrate-binding protein [Leptolyngbya sp. FACHB-261]